MSRIPEPRAATRWDTYTYLIQEAALATCLLVGAGTIMVLSFTSVFELAYGFDLLWVVVAGAISAIFLVLLTGYAISERKMWRVINHARKSDANSSVRRDVA